MVADKKTIDIKDLEFTLKDFSFKFDAPLTPDWQSTFGTNFRNPYVKVPKGIYTPEELGLPFPEVSKVYVEDCHAHYPDWKERFRRKFFEIRSGKKLIVAWQFVEVAHADNYLKTICFKSGNYIFSGPDTLDEVAVHEYAHILSPVPCKNHGINKKCTTNHHDFQFQKTCISMGILGRASIDYTYAGEPKEDFYKLKERGKLGGRIQYQGRRAAEETFEEAKKYASLQPLPYFNAFTVTGEESKKGKE